MKGFWIGQSSQRLILAERWNTCFSSLAIKLGILYQFCSTCVIWLMVYTTQSRTAIIIDPSLPPRGAFLRLLFSYLGDRLLYNNWPPLTPGGAHIQLPFRELFYLQFVISVTHLAFHVSLIRRVIWSLLKNILFVLFSPLDSSAKLALVCCTCVCRLLCYDCVRGLVLPFVNRLSQTWVYCYPSNNSGNNPQRFANARVSMVSMVKQPERDGFRL